MNGELTNLTTFLDNCPQFFLDTKSSRKRKEESPSLLMVITFHSIEERLVSQAMARWKKGKLGDQATKKAVIPSEEEIIENPKSKSAKLLSFMF